MSIYDLTSQEPSQAGREKGTVYSTKYPVDGSNQSTKKFNEYIEITTIPSMDSILLNQSFLKVKAKFDGTGYDQCPLFTPVENPFESAISKAELWINNTEVETIQNYAAAAKTLRCIMGSKEVEIICS